MNTRTKTLVNKGFLGTIVLGCLLIVQFSLGLATVRMHDSACRVELALSGTVTGSFTLPESVATASFVVDIDPDYAMAHTSSILTANLEPDGRTIVLSITNPPTCGLVNVGVIAVIDGSSNEVAFVSVTLKDGVIEVELSDI